MFSARAVLVAVFVAFVGGLLVSLAVRTPGASAGRLAPVAGEGGAPVRIHWRMPLSAPRNLPGSGETVIWLSQALKDTTDGAFVVDLYDPGEIVPAFAVTDAVRDRKVSAGYTWLGYDQGKIPSSPLIAATPFGLEPWAYIGWWYFAGGRELAEAVYAKHNMKPIFCAITGPETAGWFREPLASAEDIDGLKIRFAGLGGRAMQRVGASITMLPAGEIFQALETGVIDATEFSQPLTDRALGFSRIAKFNYYPGWHQPFSATHVVVNLDVWGEMRSSDQALLEGLCTAGVARNLGYSEAMQGPIVRGLADAGVSARALPDDLLARLRAAANEVLDEEAERDADFATILVSQREFQEVYGEWRRLAYPPRRDVDAPHRKDDH